MKPMIRGLTLLVAISCVSWLAAQRALAAGPSAHDAPIAPVYVHAGDAIADAGARTQTDQSSEAAQEAPSQPVWGSDFDSQFKKIVAAAAGNFASVVKDGMDGPEVDLDLSVLGNTDTCGYVQGGSIGAPVCIFQFDAGQDQAPASRNFNALMTHIKTLLPGWKEQKPESEDQSRLDQFTTDDESVKCSMEWSNSSGSYAIYVNFVGHPLAKARPHRKAERHRASE